MSTNSAVVGKEENKEDDATVITVPIEMIDGDQSPSSQKSVFCIRHGKMTVLCGNRRRMFPWNCTVGPDWPCMLITYSLIIGPTVYFFIDIGQALGTAMRIAVPFSAVATLLFFSCIACSDPGVVFDPYEPVGEDDIAVTCAQCQIRRPRTAMHCYDCSVCIDQMDHHCPWTGKCIGKKTLRLFYAFLWSLVVYLVLMIGSMVYRYFNYNKQ